MDLWSEFKVDVSNDVLIPHYFNFLKDLPTLISSTPLDIPTLK
jgi:hypothetical protein